MTSVAPHCFSESPVYELQPSRELPSIDLSITVRSRFCNTIISRMLDKIRQHPALVVAYVFTLLSYVVVMAAPKSLGRYLAVAAALASLPGSIVAFSLLRVDILKLLFKTYDVWFASAVWFALFIILANLVNDMRAAMMVSFWLGSWPNVCIDANVASIRQLSILNVVSIFVAIVVGICVSLEITDGLVLFDVARYRQHALSAKAVAADCFVTVTATMARNTYRRRALSQRAGSVKEIECVSLRCRLKIVLADTCTAGPILGHSKIQHIAETTTFQPIRYKPSLGRIDARHTLLPSGFNYAMSMRRTVHVIITAVGVIGFALLAVNGSARLVIEIVHTEIAVIDHVEDSIIYVGFGCSFLFCGSTLALCQRDLLWLIYTSFDFVFFMAQATFVHICVCDMFFWEPRTVMLTLTTWIWLHWVLILDAVTPVIRETLKIQRAIPRIVFLWCISAGIGLVYCLIFADPPPQVQDRILLSATIRNHNATFRMIPQFFSSLATIFLLSLRFFWHQCWNSPVELVVLDGRVVFANASLKARRLAPCRIGHQPS